MNIILFTNKRGQVWNVELNLLHFGITALAGLILLIGAAVYTGTLITEDELHHVVKWRGLVEAQQAEITEARRSAQADIDALTLRMGKMQGQMLRLNAHAGRATQYLAVSALDALGQARWKMIRARRTRTR